ncbi:hypothetical protein BDZ91DRAFT_728744, partial [Kalaharituber pfeilii]
GCQPAPSAALQRYGYQHPLHSSSFVHPFPQSLCNTYTPLPLYIALCHNSIKSKARREL